MDAVETLDRDHVNGRTSEEQNTITHEASTTTITSLRPSATDRSRPSNEYVLVRVRVTSHDIFMTLGCFVLRTYLVHRLGSL